MPVLGARLSFLTEQLAGEAQERRFQRVMRIDGLPDLGVAVGQGTFDMDRFLEVRETTGTSLIGTSPATLHIPSPWLRTLDEASADAFPYASATPVPPLAGKSHSRGTRARGLRLQDKEASILCSVFHPPCSRRVDRARLHEQMTIRLCPLPGKPRGISHRSRTRRDRISLPQQPPVSGWMCSDKLIIPAQGAFFLS
jgi:hypothetical protein